MPDAESKFARRLMEDRQPDGKSFTSERQLTAQSFNLHVEKRDGRHAEGFPWSHYAGCKWSNEGEHERLVILFGDRAVEIEGHNLGALVTEIREGQLNGIKEMVSAQVMLKEANGDSEPIDRKSTRLNSSHLG